MRRIDKGAETPSTNTRTLANNMLGKDTPPPAAAATTTAATVKAQQQYLSSSCSNSNKIPTYQQHFNNEMSLKNSTKMLPTTITASFAPTNNKKPQQQQQHQQLEMSTAQTANVGSVAATATAKQTVIATNQQTSRLEGLNQTNKSPSTRNTKNLEKKEQLNAAEVYKKCPVVINSKSSSTIASSSASATSSATVTTKQPPSFHIKSLTSSSFFTSASSSPSNTAKIAATKTSLSLLNLFFYIMCVTSLGFSLYCNVRQTHTERTLRHLREFDERLMDLEMQLQVQRQQLQRVNHKLTQQQEQLLQATYNNNSNNNNKNNNNEEEEMDDNDEDNDDVDNDEMDTGDMDYTSRALTTPYSGGNLNILQLKDAKDVTQAVRLLTRQVGELHRLRRDVSQLQLSRRQQHRRQTVGGNVSTSHERLGGAVGGGSFQECSCQPGELVFVVLFCLCKLVLIIPYHISFHFIQRH